MASPACHASQDRLQSPATVNDGTMRGHLECRDHVPDIRSSKSCCGSFYGAACGVRHGVGLPLDPNVNTLGARTHGSVCISVSYGEPELLWLRPTYCSGREQ